MNDTERELQEELDVLLPAVARYKMALEAIRCLLPADGSDFAHLPALMERIAVVALGEEANE